GLPIKVVALGSSSTRGAGASTPAACYPSRLAEELVRRLPGHKFTVLNRGVNGEDVSNMLARLDTAVIREKPDLVLWQVGTNSVLAGKAVQPQAWLLREGLTRLKATGADVVLIDPQYAPKVIAKRNADGMVSLIAATAKAEHVCHFRRFDLMRQWHETEHLPFKTFVSPDGLHMNDWSYACLAKALSLAIAEAAERPTTTAIGPSIAPRYSNRAGSTHGFAGRCRPHDKCSLDDESAHARSAADIERLASHEAIGPIAEEHHSPRHIVAAAQSLHRNGRCQRLLAFAALWNDAAKH